MGAGAFVPRDAARRPPQKTLAIAGYGYGYGIEPSSNVIVIGENNDRLPSARPGFIALFHFIQYRFVACRPPLPTPSDAPELRSGNYPARSATEVHP